MRAMRTIALAAAVAACGGPGDAPCEAELGPVGEMPDLEMHVGDTVEADLRDHFSPPGCLKVGWWDDEWLVRSADPSAVAVSVSAENILTTAALAVADSVRVSVGLIEDLSGPMPPHEFLVRVRPR